MSSIPLPEVLSSLLSSPILRSYSSDVLASYAEECSENNSMQPPEYALICMAVVRYRNGREGKDEEDFGEDVNYAASTVVAADS